MKLSDFLSRFEVIEKEQPAPAPKEKEQPAPAPKEKDQPAPAPKEKDQPAPAPEYLTREQIQDLLKSELTEFYESLKTAKRSAPVPPASSPESFEEFLKKHYES